MTLALRMLHALGFEVIARPASTVLASYPHKQTVTNSHTDLPLRHWVVFLVFGF